MLYGTPKSNVVVIHVEKGIWFKEMTKEKIHHQH